ncbi:MAG: TonB-dependent receptor [Acidobacteria bacterium]|nr:TonB-dependent receptor [Acidobacteriota bacterium]
MSKYVQRNRSLKRSGVSCLAVLLWLLMSSSIGQGQNITGTITGTVSDPNGEVLPEVQVTVQNVKTGLTRTMATDAQGNYRAPLLPVGSYMISAERQGFKKKVLTGLGLQVDQTARVDIVLDVGGIAEEITITESAPLTDTVTSQVGEVIDNRRVQELPLNGRQFLQLAMLNSGASVTTGSFDSRLQLNAPRLIMNGQMEHYNNYTVDGTDATDVFYHSLSISPSVDVIQEFKILTNNYSAEFGGFTGAMVNVSIKSGSNAFHGTVYEFLRNDQLDAKNFFDDPTKPIPPFRQNQFGATFGGRIKQDRTFFFGGYEGFRKRKALTSVAQVPSDRMRNGDLNEFIAAGQPIPNDPLTGAPFPGNIIPPDRFDPVAKGLLSILPRATSGTNYILARSESVDDDQFHIRMDHQFSSKNNFFARFSFDKMAFLEPSLVAITDKAVTSNTRNISISDVHVFRPNLINEFRFGFNRTTGGEELATKGFDFAEMTGLQGVTRVQANIGVPRFSISAFSTAYGPLQFYINRVDNTFQYIDNLTYTRGKHNLKFGGLFSRYQFNPSGDGGGRGSLSYTGAFSRNSYADFLLGLPFSGTIGLGDVTLHGRSYLLAGYVQDDWKVGPKLTLNLGVRYEYLAPVTDTDDLISTLDPRDLSRPRFVVGNNDPSRFAPGIAGRMPLPVVSAEEAGLPSSLLIPTKRNWAPRFGFAYSPFGDDKTVIRGGYGIFYAFPSFNWSAQLKYLPPFLDLRLVTNTARAFNAQNIFLAPPLGSLSLFAISPLFRIGYSQQWFLNIQRAITSDMLVEVAYIGNLGLKLMKITSLNQAQPPAPGPQGPRRLIPQLGIFSWNESRGSSNYHAMQVRIEKRASRGLGFVAQYTYGKSLDYSSTLNGSTNDQSRPQNSLDVAAEYGLSSFDHHHRLVANFIYLLPFGPGMPFLGSSKGFAGKFLQGWQVGGIITVEDGLPFTIRDGVDRSNTGEGNDRPDLVGNPNFPKSRRTVEQYFNTAAFQLQPQYTFGTAGRNIVRGPSYSNVDFSLIKTTSITESHRLEFRAEFFNLFNHPNFDIPDRTITSLSFGRIRSAKFPRDIQFALKYIF